MTKRSANAGSVRCEPSDRARSSVAGHERDLPAGIGAAVHGLLDDRRRTAGRTERARPVAHRRPGSGIAAMSRRVGGVRPSVMPRRSYTWPDRERDGRLLLAEAHGLARAMPRPPRPAGPARPAPRRAPARCRQVVDVSGSLGRPPRPSPSRRCRQPRGRRDLVRTRCPGPPRRLQWPAPAALLQSASLAAATARACVRATASDRARNTMAATHPTASATTARRRDGPATRLQAGAASRRRASLVASRKAIGMASGSRMAGYWCTSPRQCGDGQVEQRRRPTPRPSGAASRSAPRKAPIEQPRHGTRARRCPAARPTRPNSAAVCRYLVVRVRDVEVELAGLRVRDRSAPPRSRDPGPGRAILEHAQGGCPVGRPAAIAALQEAVEHGRPETMAATTTPTVPRQHRRIAPAVRAGRLSRAAAVRRRRATTSAATMTRRRRPAPASRNGCPR